MKLIRCKKCNDVVRLIHTKWRKCECGKSGGQYNDDFLSATVGGNCEVIGIRNDFFETPKRKRGNGILNILILGEYVGDVQIHRIHSANGPKLKMRIKKTCDGDYMYNKITFIDKRKYKINLKDNKSPKSITIPFNFAPSFKTKKMLTKIDLEKYGKVEVCEEKDNKFHVLITDGFTGNAVETFKLMKFIDEETEGKFPVVDKCVTDENKFHYIIRKK